MRGSRTVTQIRGLRLERLSGAVLLLAVWIAGSAAGLFSAQTLPGPGKVASTGWQLITNGTLGSALVASLERVAMGLGLGVAVGSALAVIACLSEIGDDIIDVPMQMLRTLPVLALVPLFVVWFGIGQAPKVYMIAFAVSFPIYLNLYSGIRGIDPKLLEAARTLRLSRWELLRRVILPASTGPWLVGLRYATGVAWLVLVISEQVNATNGIGYMMINAQNFLRTDIIVVGVIVYALLGLISDTLLRLLESRVLVWRMG